MRIFSHFWDFCLWKLSDQTGALTFTAIKRFKPHAGVRRGIIDITFDSSGPTWTVTKADLKLPGGIWNLVFPAHKDGFVLASVPVAGHQTITIDAREEADGASALQAIDAADLNTKVARAEYTGY